MKRRGGDERKQMCFGSDEVQTLVMIDVSVKIRFFMV